MKTQKKVWLLQHKDAERRKVLMSVEFNEDENGKGLGYFRGHDGHIVFGSMYLGQNNRGWTFETWSIIGESMKIFFSRGNWEASRIFDNLES